MITNQTMPAVQIIKRLWRSLGAKIFGTITHVSTNRPFIALTFDDGPSPVYTKRLAAILEKYDSLGTFFVIGKSVADYPEIVSRLAKGGHAICNHSWDHKSFVLLSRRQRILQLRRCEAMLPQQAHKLFRPPFGHQSFSSRIDALLLGYSPVAWSIVAQDWLDDNATQLFKRVSGQLQAGSIVLFHDKLFNYLDEEYTDMEPTLKAVDMILEKYSGRYKFVTVPKLLATGKPIKRNWLMKPDMHWISQLKTEN